ncbi:hypothetical protein PMAYCL1PPCAC_19434, partial [Pristionchus mayeri]
SASSPSGATHNQKRPGPMEVDEVANYLRRSSLSPSKKAKGDYSESLSASPVVSPSRVSARVSEADSARQEKERREAVERLTKGWHNEKPHENVEQPFPSRSNRAHFCWYDLSDSWSAETIPKAVPIPPHRVDTAFSYDNPNFARLPFSSPQSTPSMGKSKQPRDRLIAEALRSFSRGVRDLSHLESGIRSYWGRFEATTLRKMFSEASPEVCEEYLKLIGKIAQVALRSEQIVTKALPTLTTDGDVKSVSMSQEQAACLLAYSFFCTVMPRGKQGFGHFSFHLIHYFGESIHMQKMKFILWYFKTVTDEMPRGTLTFSRQAWAFQRDEREGYDKWRDEISEFLVTSEGLIEEMEGCLQVDFANEFIGGGVMKRGAVQEEIRFMCCPEMLVSMFLCNRMNHHEAILIQGAQQYSAYEGYSSSLRHVPMELRRDQPRDRFGRARSYLVAIDAIEFDRSKDQYESRYITREIKKAYAGFMLSQRDTPARPIATGNWGCGAFNGDKELKSVIQLIAASKAGRPMIYVTFK